MRAYAVDEFGADGSVREIPIPEPGDGEVLVAVRAAGVNAMDPLFVIGAYKDYMDHRLPLTPGIDLAGVVERVGPGVDGFAPGDAVYGVSARPFVGTGTFAEYVAVAVGDVSPKPASLSFTEAASVPHAALTALAAIEAADPQPGQTVVVVGATGGVGSFVTQMAAARGARVVAVSATPGVALSSELGATETIDHEAVDVGSTLRTRYPAGVDTLITMYGDVETVTGMAQSVRTGGLVVSPAMRADAVSSTFEKLGVTFTGVSRLSPARLPELTTLLDAGKLRVPPVTAFQLERAGDAIGEMATGHVRGKLVIAIS